MMIPPCGLIYADEYQKISADARKRRVGIWGEVLADLIPQEKAHNHMKEFKGVRGKVLGVYVGKKALHFNFGEDWKKDFTMTIFKKDLPQFSEMGLDPKKEYANQEILIFGFIQEYYGPQIIVRSPSQVEVK